MGCTSSKRIDTAVAADVYRPAPSSFAVFDITTIEEPWLNNGAAADEKQQHSHLPPPILEKLKSLEDGSRSWDEVSKVLDDLKPKLNGAVAQPDSNLKPAPATPPAQNSPAAKPRPLTKNFSYHTLEELEAKITAEPAKRAEPTKRFESSRTELVNPSSDDVPKSLKDNIFIVRDRLEREGSGKPAGFVKRDPLGDFEERCPPGGAGTVVIYTTSLGGVRRTFEDCNRVRQLMETQGVAFDERDVALDAGFLGELRELLGDGGGGTAMLPRVFVKGRYLGGVEEVVALNETGRLSRILNWAKVERGPGRLGCRGCGGARFVPCLGCGGSCKVMVGDTKERCGECNENGLAHCPLCA